MGSHSDMRIHSCTSLFSLRRSMCPHLLLCIAGMSGLIPLLCPSTAAQDVTTTTTLRVQSQLVVLDVVVTDKAGNLVTNLGRDDFEVSENGVQQEIRNFDSPHQVDTIPVTAPKDKFGRE